MLLAAGALVTLPADAADLPQDAVRYRQGIMTALAWNMAPLAYMVKGEHAFDDARFTVLAARTAVLASCDSGTSFSAPPKLPMAVRVALTTKISGLFIEFSSR